MNNSLEQQAKKKSLAFRIARIASAIMILIFATAAFIPRNSAAHKALIGLPGNAADEKRIDSIVGAMTVEEKVAMLCGNGMFSSSVASRLGIADLHYADGPTGIREELEAKGWRPLGLTTDSATFFPNGSALAATWNPEMAHLFGTGIGQEAKTRGKDILLAPAVNITRIPEGGRTFEYMSEDPYLNSRLTVGYINGVQESGVAACVKHFAANNQETMRDRVNVLMDERTLREIYLPAFKAAVEEAHVYTVMSAYNKLRGSYCGENKYLLTDVLKKEWNFKGFVMSDWGGTHSTVKAAINGLDVEMGTNRYFTAPLLDSVKKGIVPMAVIDDKVRRILRVKLFTMKTPVPPQGTMVSTDEHQKMAYDIASQSIVLLKNKQNLLPLDLKGIKSIAIIGDNAIQKHASGGFGAGVKTRIEVTPLEGLKSRIGKSVQLVFAQGYKPQFERNPRGFGRHPSSNADSSLLNEAVELAKKSDMAILFLGNNRNVESEAWDRSTLELPFGQDALIKAVTAVNPKTILVIVAGAPVDMKTADASAGSILWSWFNGSQGGNALADVLVGKINPSGKMPFTIPVSLDDTPAHALKTFPGDSIADYKEGILVGYRWYDTKNVAPEYCFGYGLSYTNFNFGDFKADKKEYKKDEVIHLNLKLKNSGKRDGMETVQIYVSDMDPKVSKAARELKAFDKVLVKAGAEQVVNLRIKASDLSYFDNDKMQWVLSPGRYKIAAGSSSRDLKVATEISIQ